MIIGRGVKYEQALAYCCSVREAFQDKNEIYRAFVDVMTNFENKRIGVPGLVTKVMALFRGHQGLISEFVTYLPEPKNIIVACEETTNLSRSRIEPLAGGGVKKEEFYEAFAYAHSVQETYDPHKKEIFKAFTDVLIDYEKKRIGIFDVLPRIEDLFQDHEELVLGFTEFLSWYRPIKRIIDQ